MPETQDLVLQLKLDTKKFDSTLNQVATDVANLQTVKTLKVNTKVTETKIARVTKALENLKVTPVVDDSKIETALKAIAGKVNIQLAVDDANIAATIKDIQTRLSAQKFSVGVEINTADVQNQLVKAFSTPLNKQLEAPKGKKNEAKAELANAVTAMLVLDTSEAEKQIQAIKQNISVGITFDTTTVEAAITKLKTDLTVVTASLELDTTTAWRRVEELRAPINSSLELDTTTAWRRVEELRAPINSTLDLDTAQAHQRTDDLKANVAKLENKKTLDFSTTQAVTNVMKVENAIKELDAKMLAAAEPAKKKETKAEKTARIEQEKAETVVHRTLELDTTEAKAKIDGLSEKGIQINLDAKFSDLVEKLDKEALTLAITTPVNANLVLDTTEADAKIDKLKAPINVTLDVDTKDAASKVGVVEVTEQKTTLELDTTDAHKKIDALKENVKASLELDTTEAWRRVEELREPIKTQLDLDTTLANERTDAVKASVAKLENKKTLEFSTTQAVTNVMKVENAITELETKVAKLSEVKETKTTKKKKETKVEPPTLDLDTTEANAKIEALSQKGINIKLNAQFADLVDKLDKEAIDLALTVPVNANLVLDTTEADAKIDKLKAPITVKYDLDTSAINTDERIDTNSAQVATEALKEPVHTSLVLDTTDAWKKIEELREPIKANLDLDTTEAHNRKDALKADVESTLKLDTTAAEEAVEKLKACLDDLKTQITLPETQTQTEQKETPTKLELDTTEALAKIEALKEAIPLTLDLGNYTTEIEELGKLLNKLGNTREVTLSVTKAETNILKIKNALEALQLKLAVSVVEAEGGEAPAAKKTTRKKKVKDDINAELSPTDVARLRAAKMMDERRAARKGEKPAESSTPMATKLEPAIDNVADAFMDLALKTEKAVRILSGSTNTQAITFQKSIPNDILGQSESSPRGVARHRQSRDETEVSVRKDLGMRLGADDKKMLAGDYKTLLHEIRHAMQVEAKKAGRAMEYYTAKDAKSPEEVAQIGKITKLYPASEQDVEIDAHMFAEKNIALAKTMGITLVSGEEAAALVAKNYLQIAAELKQQLNKLVKGGLKHETAAKALANPSKEFNSMQAEVKTAYLLQPKQVPTADVTAEQITETRRTAARQLAKAIQDAKGNIINFELPELDNSFEENYDEASKAFQKLARRVEVVVRQLSGSDYSLGMKFNESIPDEVLKNVNPKGVVQHGQKEENVSFRKDISQRLGASDGAMLETDFNTLLHEIRHAMQEEAKRARRLIDNFTEQDARSPQELKQVQITKSQYPSNQLVDEIDARMFAEKNIFLAKQMGIRLLEGVDGAELVARSYEKLAIELREQIDSLQSFGFNPQEIEKKIASSVKQLEGMLSSVANTAILQPSKLPTEKISSQEIMAETNAANKALITAMSAAKARLDALDLPPLPDSVTYKPKEFAPREQTRFAIDPAALARAKADKAEREAKRPSKANFELPEVDEGLFSFLDDLDSYIGGLSGETKKLDPQDISAVDDINDFIDELSSQTKKLDNPTFAFVDDLNDFFDRLPNEIAKKKSDSQATPVEDIQSFIDDVASKTQAAKNLAAEEARILALKEEQARAAEKAIEDEKRALELIKQYTKEQEKLDKEDHKSAAAQKKQAAKELAAEEALAAKVIRGFQAEQYAEEKRIAAEKERNIKSEAAAQERAYKDLMAAKKAAAIAAEKASKDEIAAAEKVQRAQAKAAEAARKETEEKQEKATRSDKRSSSLANETGAKFFNDVVEASLPNISEYVDSLSDLYVGLLRVAEETGDMNSAFAKVKNPVVFTLAFAGLTMLAKAALPVLDSFAQLEKAMGAVDGASFRDSMQNITDIALKTGADLGETAKSFSKFQISAVGTTFQDQADEIFASVAQYGAAIGASNDEMGRGYNALQQISAKGKVSLEELNGQLAEAIPGATNLAAKGLGLTKGELIKAVAAGDIMADEMLPALAKELKKTSTAMEAVSPKTLEQEFGILKNQGILGTTKAFKPLYEVMRGSVSLLNSVTDATNQTGIGAGLASTAVTFLSLAMLRSGAAMIQAKMAARETAVDFKALGKSAGIALLQIAAITAAFVAATEIYSSFQSEDSALFDKQAMEDDIKRLDAVISKLQEIKDLKGKPIDDTSKTPVAKTLSPYGSDAEINAFKEEYKKKNFFKRSFADVGGTIRAFSDPTLRKGALDLKEEKGRRGLNTLDDSADLYALQRLKDRGVLEKEQLSNTKDLIALSKELLTVQTDKGIMNLKDASAELDSLEKLEQGYGKIKATIAVARDNSNDPVEQLEMVKQSLENLQAAYPELAIPVELQGASTIEEFEATLNSLASEGSADVAILATALENVSPDNLDAEIKKLAEALALLPKNTAEYREQKDLLVEAVAARDAIVEGLKKEQKLVKSITESYNKYKDLRKQNKQITETASKLSEAYLYVDALANGETDINNLQFERQKIQAATHAQRMQQLKQEKDALLAVQKEVSSEDLLALKTVTGNNDVGDTSLNLKALTAEDIAKAVDPANKDQFSNGFTEYLQEVGDQFLEISDEFIDNYSDQAQLALEVRSEFAKADDTIEQKAIDLSDKFNSALDSFDSSFNSMIDSLESTIFNLNRSIQDANFEIVQLERENRNSLRKEDLTRQADQFGGLGGKFLNITQDNFERGDSIRASRAALEQETVSIAREAEDGVKAIDDTYVGFLDGIRTFKEQLEAIALEQQDLDYQAAMNEAQKTGYSAAYTNADTSAFDATNVNAMQALTDAMMANTKTLGAKQGIENIISQKNFGESVKAAERAKLDALKRDQGDGSRYRPEGTGFKKLQLGEKYDGARYVKNNQGQFLTEAQTVQNQRKKAKMSDSEIEAYAKQVAPEEFAKAMSTRKEAKAKTAELKAAKEKAVGVKTQGLLQDEESNRYKTKAEYEALNKEILEDIAATAKVVEDIKKDTGNSAIEKARAEFNADAAKNYEDLKTKSDEIKETTKSLNDPEELTKLKNAVLKASNEGDTVGAVEAQNALKNFTEAIKGYEKPLAELDAEMAKQKAESDLLGAAGEKFYTRKQDAKKKNEKAIEYVNARQGDKYVNQDESNNLIMQSKKMELEVSQSDRVKERFQELKEQGMETQKAFSLANEEIRRLDRIELKQLNAQLDTVSNKLKDSLAGGLESIFDLDFTEKSATLTEQLYGVMNQIAKDIQSYASKKLSGFIMDALFPNESEELQTPQVLAQVAGNVTDSVGDEYADNTKQTVEQINNADDEATNTLIANKQKNKVKTATLIGGGAALAGGIATGSKTAIGAGIGAIAGSFFGPAGGQIGGALGGLLGGLFYDGGEITTDHNKNQTLESAFQMEKMKSGGKQPVLAMLHEGEEVVSTKNGDAEKYRAFKASGMMDLNPDLFASGGTVGMGGNYNYSPNSSRNSSVKSINTTTNVYNVTTRDADLIPRNETQKAARNRNTFGN